MDSDSTLGVEGKWNDWLLKNMERIFILMHNA